MHKLLSSVCFLSNEKFDKKKAGLVIIIVSAVILASLPLFRQGMFAVHDFTQGARIVEMHRALADGHFPVRWSQNFGFGYGMPLFQFYGPLPFYVGALIYWLTGQVLFAVKSIFLITNIFTAWGGYLLGKKLLKNRVCATFVSIALTLAPYRLLNLYVRGAVNELWGIMAIPWILLSVIKILNSEKSAWVWLSLSLSVLFLSHNITTLMFAPFAMLIVILLLMHQMFIKNIATTQFFRYLVKIIWPTALALGLSAFYLFPAFFEKDFTQVDRYILADYFDFRIHFLYLRQFFRTSWGYGGSNWGPDDKISFFLGFGQLAGVTIFLFLFLKQFFSALKISVVNAFKQHLLPLGFLLLSLLSIVLTTHKSSFIWENISLMKFIQFPWRFLSLGLVFLSLMGGYALLYLQKNTSTQTNKISNNLSIILTGILFGLLMLNGIYVKPEEQLADSTLYYHANEAKIRDDLSWILPDYIPINLKHTNPVYTLINEDLLETDERSNFEVVRNATHLKFVKTDFTQESVVEFNVADYPHWQLLMNSIPVPHTTTEEGSISVIVKPSQQELVLRLKPTRLRLVSDLVSLTSFIAIVVLLLRQKFAIRLIENSVASKSLNKSLLN